jgi:K+-sensing histidine kinase KdpD
MMKMLHATVSHDMTTPVSSIRVFADELVEAVKERNEGQIKKYHQMICDSSKLVSCRMKDLLDMNLIEHNLFVPRET